MKKLYICKRWVGVWEPAAPPLPTTTLLQILTFLFTSSGGGLGGVLVVARARNKQTQPTNQDHKLPINNTLVFK
jgi:hypothetical protein